MAMGVLASGAEYWKTLNVSSFMAQAKNTGGFWMSFHELTGDYPWLCKRMRHIVAVGEGGRPKFPRRSVWAGFFALFVPRFGLGGGGAGVIVAVAIVGILAAVALPAYQDYTIRWKVSSAFIAGEQDIKEHATLYIEQHGRLPNRLSDIGMADDYSNESVQSVAITDDGFVMQISQPPQVAGKTIIYTPYRDEQNKLQWRCNGGTLDKRYRPPACQ